MILMPFCKEIQNFSLKKKRWSEGKRRKKHGEMPDMKLFDWRWMVEVCYKISPYLNQQFK